VQPLLKTGLLLAASNVFMTLAWYWHLRGMRSKTLLLAILVSWGIAFFEYCLMVPANRIGHQAGLRLDQLKIMQEAITLAIFVPMALLIADERPRLDYVWAGLCLVGAVYFIFRSP